MMMIDQSEEEYNNSKSGMGKNSQNNKRREYNSNLHGTIYKAVVQSILLCETERWVLNKTMKRKLNNFLRRCTRCVARDHIRPNEDGTWTYPDTD